MQNKNNNQNQPTGSNSPGQPAPQTLLEHLASIPDFRRGQGKMHNLDVILILMLMATLSGYFGQRATGDFFTKHYKELVEALHPKKDKLPSYQTIARVMYHLDYDQLSAAFFAWAKTVVPISERDWASLDGKAIHGTTTDARTPQQSYTNLVSLFATKTGLVITQGKVTNKSNEIPLVAELVSNLGLTGLVLTADALHCQKNTTEAIVASGNDYVIGVKGNQKKLYEQLKKGAVS
jgi:hypothetical protein